MAHIPTFEKTVSDNSILKTIPCERRPSRMENSLCRGPLGRFHVRVRYFEKFSRPGDPNFLPWNHCTFIAGCATKILNLPIPFSKVSSFLYTAFPFNSYFMGHTKCSISYGPYL